MLPSSFLLLALSWSAPAAPDVVQFNRDIRPILSDNCFQCHGPDQARRKAKLRLDTEEGAAAVLVSGDPAKSTLYQRLTATKEDKHMPPPSTGRTLSAPQLALIRRWIEQGAKWQKHWSLLAPVRPALPPVQNEAWPRNPIDHFILARLERDGLTPSAEADKTTLLRRVTLDLTGLPPTPAEVDAFLADESPNAYEKVVERLLTSPRYGERMAIRWLDAARYADTSGYQSDGDRIMWRWRDWVIDALNRNLPFDQFTIEQLAGDLLPNATLEQKLATGFNRNHRGNGEGGIIPEEYAAEYVVDRVETTATVWLGLTLGCARCHDHKFDPLTQKEFYQVFAYFNNVPEYGRAIKVGNSPPYLKTPTPQMQRDLAALETRLAAAEKVWRDLEPRLAQAQAAWEKSLDGAQPLHWTPARRLTAHFELDGRTGKASDFDGSRCFEAGDGGHFGYMDKFSLGAWIYPRQPHGTILSRMTDAPRAEGYAVRLEDGRIHVDLTKRWLDDAIRVETETSLEPGCWYHVLVTYDGSRLAQGITIYVDGQPVKVRVLLDELNQTFATKEPLRIGAGGGPESRFQGRIADVRIHDDVLRPEEVAWLAATEPLNEIVALPAERRSRLQADRLRAYFLENHAPESLRQAHAEAAELRAQRERLIESFPTTMVMQEMDAPRATHVLIRGQYDKKGERVLPGVPARLPPLPEGGPNNRLRLARWLVDPANPLTARVQVNRYWQMYFGSGLVKTVEDFGSQGEWPSHPELLDWLATEFVRTGWDVKALQRTIVQSATYRQSSKVTRALVQKDPDNRLLARGPRLRLSAEMVRDQALAASGLLVERLGGPSVKPYQPAGLIKELTGTEDYKQDHGDKLYRRSLYTFWKRTVAPPAMVAFDASAREACVVRETRTNTPLQALDLLNDVTYVEAARVLAERVMVEGGTTPQERIALAFRLVTGRKPKPVELQILLAGFEQHLGDYRKDREAARKLVSMGEAPRNAQLDVSELAAYTTVAGLILNLDEAITKE